MRRVGQFGGVISNPIRVPLQTFHNGLTDLVGVGDGLAHLLAHLELNAGAGGQMRQVVLAADPSDELAADQHDDAVIAAAAGSTTNTLLDALREQRRDGRIGDHVHSEHVVI